MSIESGQPVQLFASLDQMSDVDSAVITADETITVSAFAIDQHGNLVTNEVISFIPSNGSIDSSGIFFHIVQDSKPSQLNGWYQLHSSGNTRC